MLIHLSDICKKYSIQPKCVLHVGACQMEEIDDYVKQEVQKVIWIEANPELVNSNKLKAEGAGHMLFQGLIYDEDDIEMDFNISNNLQSSSILEFKKHLDYHPHVSFENKIRMKTTRLDSLLQEKLIDHNEIDFLNLDIQGVELRAIKGLGVYLDTIKYIYTEINVGQVYEGNDELKDLDDFLNNKGFKRVETNLTPYEWGDAFYIKG
jgi:FkbM family methyltransferase